MNTHVCGQHTDIDDHCNCDQQQTQKLNERVQLLNGDHMQRTQYSLTVHPVGLATAMYTSCVICDLPEQ